MKLNAVGQRIAVLLLSLTVCFILAEVAVRFYLGRVTIYDIEMSRYSMSIKTDAKNPLIGHVHRPNSSARLMNVPVQINSDGLRDREYPVERGNERRIVFLGDSLTLAWGVEQPASFENLIEQRLNAVVPTEVLNFGTGNYNTEQEVNLFLEKGLKYRPDQVVLFYFINDAEQTPRKSKLWFLAYSRLISFYWSRIYATISNLAESKSFSEYYADLYRDDQEGWARTQRAFVQLRDVCREKGIRLQVVMLPELHNLKEYPFKREYAMVASFLEGAGIDVLDITPRFEGYEHPTELWVSLDDAHPNAKAHRMIADYSLDYIADGIGGGTHD